MKPYRLINSQELKQLTEQFSTILAEWSQHYCLHPIQCTLSLPSTQDFFIETGYVKDEQGQTLACIHDEIIPIMQDALFGEPLEAFNSTSDTLFLHLMSCLFEREPCIVTNSRNVNNKNTWLYPGSAALLLELNSPTQEMTLLINPEWVHNALPLQTPRGALHSLEETLEAQPLTLHLELSAMHLPIKHLAELQVGDLLVTDHLLSNPMFLNQGKKAFATAELGTTSYYKSTQLKEFI